MSRLSTNSKPRPAECNDRIAVRLVSDLPQPASRTLSGINGRVHACVQAVEELLDETTSIADKMFGSAPTPNNTTSKPELAGDVGAVIMLLAHLEESLGLLADRVKYIGQIVE